MSLNTIEGIKEGAQVRLRIEVKGATMLNKWADAEQVFIYQENANLSAYYEATGTVFDAAVSFKKYRDPE